MIRSPRRRPQRRIGVPAIVALMIVSACSTGSAGNQLSAGEAVQIGAHTENRVTVQVELHDEPGGLSLVATYTPLDEGWHLYSKDLAPTGVDGVGRPTVLAVTGGDLVAAGPATTSSLTQDLVLESLSAPIPTYPDGPVQLALPVKRTNTTDDLLDVAVAVSYMACSSDGGCQPPVTARPLNAKVALTP